MCTKIILPKRGDTINKKTIMFIIILIIVALFLIMPSSSTYDFEGLFTIDLPPGQNYWNVAWCHEGGGLGCKNEYWERDAGCDINGKEVVVYYYNGSLLEPGQTDVGQYAVDTLNKSYIYQFYQSDGDLIVLKNDIGMHAVPPFMVGKISDDRSEAVFVGGCNLDDLKEYSRSVEFK